MTNMDTKGYESKKYGQPTKRYVQILDLKSDEADFIQGYKKVHDKEHFWPEIGEGIRAVGILEMELYILGNRLVPFARQKFWRTAFFV